LGEPEAAEPLEAGAVSGEWCVSLHQTVRTRGHEQPQLVPIEACMALLEGEWHAVHAPWLGEAASSGVTRKYLLARR
jgi:hypothetical protein